MSTIRYFDKAKKHKDILYLQRNNIESSSLIMNFDDYNTIVVIIDGKAIFHLGKRKFEIIPGDVFFINTEKDFSKIEEIRNLKSYCLIYQKEKNENIDKNKKYFYDIVSNFSKKEYINYINKLRIRLNKNELNLIKNLYSMMNNELVNKEYGYGNMLYSYFVQLTTFLSRKYYNSIKDNPIIETEELSEALKFIEENFKNKINLKELSLISNMSVNNFLKKFKQAFNTTPISYINNLRIEKACELLYDNGIPITDIAYYVGFDDSTYFTRKFKKIMKKTPRDFRKLILKNEG